MMRFKYKSYPLLWSIHDCLETVERPFLNSCDRYSIGSLLYVLSNHVNPHLVANVVWISFSFSSTLMLVTLQVTGFFYHCTHAVM